MRESDSSLPHAPDASLREQELARERDHYKHRYEQLVDAAYEGIWQIDARGYTVFANRRMAEMLGYSLAELQRLSMYDVSHPEDRARASQNLSRRMEGASGQHEWRFIRKDGSELWCIIAATPTYDDDGNADGALGLIVDITERKLAEARLRRISRLYAVASHVNETIARVREPDALYRDACRIAVEQGGVRLAWIGLVDADGKFEIKGHHGGNDAYIELVIERVSAEDNIAGPGRRALREGVTCVANDIANDATFYWKEPALALGLRSCAAFPLRTDDRVIGIMAIYADQVNYFDDEELRVLNALADDISFAVGSANQQRALQEQERMMTTLFATLPGMTYRCRNDAQWTMEVASPGCLDLTGYAAESFLQNREVSFEDIIHPQDRRSVREHVDAALAQRRPYELSYRIVTRSGEIKWVWERGTGVYDATNSLRFLEGFITDITARREAEAQVAAQAALLDKATDAIVLYGMDDTVYYWNRGAERLYGWPTTEAIGSKISQLICRDTTRRRALVAKLIEDGEWAGELTHFTKDGNEVIVDASWTLVRDDRGAPASILAINTDITERKKLEAQFLTTQRMESIGTLAGGIAHDFNNLLTAISGNAKLAAAELPADHPLQTYVREIEKAGLRASELVRQILTFSRREHAQRQALILRDVIAESLRLLRATLPAQIDIVAQYGDAIPVIAADATQMHQVMINLGTNAAYAMRERGGVLSIHLDGIEVDRGHDLPVELAPGRYARLTVNDTGEGMDATTQSRIFEPFFTTKAPGQGTGLGLSVVHGIVRSHDGAISVTSNKGRGTTFVLYFPQTEQQAFTSQAIAPTPVRGTGQRILYVDDEEALVFLTTRVLERLGYQVTGRSDAVQALNDFRADPSQFDAVVSDLSMPVMTGPDLARQMLAIRHDIPIVLTSGYIRDEDIAHVRALGIRDIVLKPNTVEDLGTALHRALAKDEPASR